MVQGWITYRLTVDKWPLSGAIVRFFGLMPSRKQGHENQTHNQMGPSLVSNDVVRFCLAPRAVFIHIFPRLHLVLIPLVLSMRVQRGDRKEPRKKYDLRLPYNKTPRSTFQ